jgi:hypothetical protein
VRIYFALLGVALLAGASWLFYRRWRVALHGARTVGRVVAFEQREDEGSVYFLPVVEFSDAHAVVHRFTAVAGHTEQRPAVGSPIAVHYLAGSPELAFIPSFLHMWAAPLGLFVLGLGSLLAAVKW